MIVYGFSYGTITRGGDIWYYDTRDGSKGLIVNSKSSIEMNSLRFNNDNFNFNVYRHFNGYNNIFCAKYEKSISKNQIYDLINTGEIMTIDVEPIPEPDSIYDYGSAKLKLDCDDFPDISELEKRTNVTSVVLGLENAESEIDYAPYITALMALPNLTKLELRKTISGTILMK